MERLKTIIKNEMDWISLDGNDMNGFIGPVAMPPFYPGVCGLESKR
jgi:hypothetical protein